MRRSSEGLAIGIAAIAGVVAGWSRSGVVAVGRLGPEPCDRLDAVA